MSTLTRREALQIAGLAAVAAAASPMIALAQATAFPKGRFRRPASCRCAYGAGRACTRRNVE